MESRTRKSSEYFTKTHYAKHHKFVRAIYLQTYKTPRSFPLVLLDPALKRCVDPVDHNIEEF